MSPFVPHQARCGKITRVNTQPTLKPSPRAWRWLALIAAVHVLLGVGFAAVVPPLEKLDEFIHWDYIRYLRREGTCCGCIRC
jgi:hypothetical protein